MPKRVFVEFRAVEALFTGKSAAQNVLNSDHFGAAAAGDRGKLIDRTHLAHAADRMNGDRPGDRRKRQTRQYGVMDELDAVVHRKPRSTELPHPVRARTRVEHDWPAAIFAGQSCSTRVRARTGCGN